MDLIGRRADNAPFIFRSIYLLIYLLKEVNNFYYSTRLFQGLSFPKSSLFYAMIQVLIDKGNQLIPEGDNRSNRVIINNVNEGVFCI